MPRAIYKFDENGKFREVYNDSRPEVNAPNVITDEREAFESHADGKMYTSMRKYEQALKEQGYVVVDKEFLKPRQPDLAALQRQSLAETRDITERALNDVKYGMAPLTEREKEQCHREQREIQNYKKRMR